MSERVVIVDTPEIAARGAELFPGSTVFFANGQLPPEALTYPDALVFSKDLDRITTFGLAFAAAQCKRIRFANADISMFNREQIVAMNEAGQIRLFKVPEPVEKTAEAEPPTKPPESPTDDAPPDWHADIPSEAEEAALRSIRESSALKRIAHESAEPDDWTEPADFWGVAPPPVMPQGAIPPAIEPYVTDQAARAGVDPAQVALNCYVVCASMLRIGIDLQMQEDSGEDGRTWREKPVLWGAVVGDPSTGKGPALDIAVHKFFKIASVLRQKDESAWQQYDKDCKVHEKRMQAWYNDQAKSKTDLEEPTPPTKPPKERLWTDDVTKEVVAKLLTENPRGKIAIVKDELASWFGGMDAYSSTGIASKDKPDWLSFYESKERYIDRAMEGRSYHVPSWGGCILGGIQPDTMSRIAGKLGADGMLQRFQIILASPKRQVAARPSDPDAVRQWNRVLENLASMQSPGRSVRLSAEAAQFMDERVRWIAEVMQAGLPASLVAALGKWEGLFGRLMITSHCIECAAQGLGQPSALVPLRIAEQCWNWLRYLLWPHAVAFYTGMADQNESQKDVRAFAEYVLARDIRKFVTVELGRKWSRYRDSFKTIQQRREFWAAVRHSGWVRPDSGIERNEGIFSRYEVNPAVFDGRFSTQAAKARDVAEAYRRAMHPAMLAQQGREPGQEG